MEISSDVVRFTFEGVSTMENTADMTRENELAFTQQELEELKRARALPIVFDEDCPEITPEQAVRFKRVNPIKRVAN